jgi:hypothetical protein
MDVAHSPNVFGLRLGMTLQEATAKWPERMSFFPDAGDGYAFGDFRVQPTIFASCKFLDNKLFYFKVSYPGLDARGREFSDMVEKKFDLKPEWNQSLSENGGLFVCNGFTFTFYGAGYPERNASIRVEDTKLAAIHSQREDDKRHREQDKTNLGEK